MDAFFCLCEESGEFFVDDVDVLGEAKGEHACKGGVVKGVNFVLFFEFGANFGDPFVCVFCRIGDC